MPAHVFLSREAGGSTQLPTKPNAMMFFSTPNNFSSPVISSFYTASSSPASRQIPSHSENYSTFIVLLSIAMHSILHFGHLIL
jgi:hypothetical protein